MNAAAEVNSEETEVPVNYVNVTEIIDQPHEDGVAQGQPPLTKKPKFKYVSKRLPISGNSNASRVNGPEL